MEDDFSFLVVLTFAFIFLIKSTGCPTEIQEIANCAFSLHSD